MTEINAVDQVVTDTYAIYQGDCCELIRGIPAESVHFGIHSPPFEGLYKFSNYDRDLSNNEGGAFWEHYAFLIQELLRVTMPGRLHAVHVMQLPMSKIRHGNIGMRDFRGEVIRAYEDAGWIFHSEVCIWKDPVIAQQRTKSIRLLHKQVTKDSTISGQGLADYIVTFRKPGENPEPVDGMFEDFHGAGLDISREAYDRLAAQLKAEGGRQEALAVRHVGLGPGLAALRLTGLDGHRPDPNPAVSRRSRREGRAAYLPPCSSTSSSAVSTSGQTPATWS